MKKRLFILLFLSVSLLNAHAQTRSEKRGAGTNNMAYRANFEVLADGLSWLYNWSYAAPTVISEDFEDLNMEYIPMIWGHGIDQEHNQDAVRAYLQQHPSIKYILAFNEPNFSSQANIGPRRAAEYWPYIEQIAAEFDLTIVGPALNFAPANGTCVEDGKAYANPFDWYDDFFAACPDCRVDHIAVHLYMGGTKSMIDQFAERYHKPIWLTEFNYNTGGTATAEDHMNFLTTEIRDLEKNPDIFRYAWFMTYSSVRPINLLQPGEGKLTDLGKFYTQYSSFDENHYFQPEQTIQAEHYIDFNSVKVRPDTTDDGKTLIVQDISNGSWVEYQVELPEAGNYYLQLRLACKTNAKIQVLSNGQQIAEYLPTPTAQDDFAHWQTQTVPVQLPAGKQTIRVKSAGRMFYLNHLKISREPYSALPDINADRQVATYYLYAVDGRLLYGGKDCPEYTDGLYILQTVYTDGSIITKKICRRN